MQCEFNVAFTPKSYTNLKNNFIMENDVKDVNFVGNGKEQGKKIQLVMKWADLQKITKWKSKKGEEFLTLDLLPRQKVSEWNHTHVIVEHKKLEKQVS